MANNFQVRDAYGSVITIQSSIFGTDHRQIIGGNLTLGNTSISGIVGASIIGLPPVNVVNPISSVFIVGNPSISGTVQVGNFPTNQNISGSVVAFGTIGASIIGLTPVNVANTNINVGGSVIAFVSNSSVLAFQGTAPWVIGSIVGTYAEDAPSATADKGLFSLGVRNDTVASLVSADLDYGGFAQDSAGRTITKPFAATESMVEGIAVITSTSVTTMIASAGTGLKNYITDIFIANTGSITTLITFKDGLGSILGYTIAPATGGSNMPGLATPMRTGAATTFDILPASPTSTLYATVKGFKGP